MALAALYLSTGRFMPPEAKAGCTFGFCDAAGWMCPMAEATHVGWTPIGETPDGGA